MLKVIAGDDPADAGQVTMVRGTRLGVLRQEIDPRQSHSVEQEAATALAELDALAQEIAGIEAEMSRLGEAHEVIPEPLAARYDEAQSHFQQAGGYEREARVARVLAGLGFDDEARKRSLSSFSGGWLMRVELAKLFLAQPDVLLLDEPTNHLDLPAIQWFEETIREFPGAVVVVSHDRTFLQRHVRRVVELDGLGRCEVYEAGYQRYLELRQERREQLLAQKANQDREIAQMERFVARFRAKATKAKQAQSRIKALEKIERIEVAPEGKRAMRMKIQPPPRSGQQVMHLDHVRKAYGENVVYEDVSFTVQRAERVALAGPNGAGKSTLLRMVAGALAPDGGDRVVGHNVQIAFFAQHQLEALDESLSVLEELTKDALTEDVPRLRGHLGAFLFSGEDVDKNIGVLSGGEKARVALAKLLLRPTNLLVLDEPTNHLDIVSCEVLEEALQSYEGTLGFVSHDRAFINALATRVVDVNRGKLRDYIGNYDDYLHRRRQESERAAAEARARAAAAPDLEHAEAAEQPAQQPAPAPQTKAERQAERERRKRRDKVKRKVEQLEASIEEHESAHEKLGWRMGDPEVARDPDQLTALQGEREALESIIAESYDEWERLGAELSALEDVL